MYNTFAGNKGIVRTVFSFTKISKFLGDRLELSPSVYIVLQRPLNAICDIPRVSVCRKSVKILNSLSFASFNL